jgi:hypothetical protein
MLDCNESISQLKKKMLGCEENCNESISQLKKKMLGCEENCNESISQLKKKMLGCEENCQKTEYPSQITHWVARKIAKKTNTQVK